MAGSFGDFVRYMRGRQPGLTQQKLGEAVGRDRTYINKIEQGKIGLPQYELRTALGVVLGFSDDDLEQFGVHSSESKDDASELIRVPIGLDVAIAHLIEQPDERGRVVWSDQAVIHAVRVLSALSRIPFYDREAVVRDVEAAAANPSAIGEAPGDHAVFPKSSPAADVVECLRHLTDKEIGPILTVALAMAEHSERHRADRDDGPAPNRQAG